MSLTVGIFCPPSLEHRSQLNLPVNATILSAAAKNYGFGAEVIDFNPIAEASGLAYYEAVLDNVMAEIDRRQDSLDILGFTTVCSTYPLVLQVTKLCKERYDKPIVLGGVQATMTAHRTMELFDWVDVVVLQEGDITLPELLQAFAKERDFSTVNGILYRKDGEIVATHPREMLDNLDDSPFPDFDALDLPLYQKIYPNLRVPIDSGRACAFNCTFCSTSVMWGRHCRLKSPARVISEMDALYKAYGINRFFFAQDNFTHRRAYLEEFCQMVLGRQYGWECYSRVDTLPHDLLDLVKEAGCTHIFFGVESVSPKTQREIKKNIRLDRVDASVQECIRRDISYTTSFIIGFPTETRREVEQTLTAVVRNAARRPFQVIFNVLTPFPGTELTQRYREQLTAPLAYQAEMSPFQLKGETAEQARKWILAYPDIFSAFYFVKPDHLAVEELFQFRRVLGVFLDHFPCTTHAFLSHVHQPLLEFLAEFESHKNGVVDFLKTTVKRHSEKINDGEFLVRDLLSYEAAIYELRQLPLEKRETKQGEGRYVRCSPTARLHEFSCDIEATFENLRYDRLISAPKEGGQRILFYLDLENDDVVTAELDEESAGLFLRLGWEALPKETLIRSLSEAEKQIFEKMCEAGIIIQSI